MGLAALGVSGAGLIGIYVHQAPLIFQTLGGGLTFWGVQGILFGGVGSILVTGVFTVIAVIVAPTSKDKVSAKLFKVGNREYPIFKIQTFDSTDVLFQEKSCVVIENPNSKKYTIFYSGEEGSIFQTTLDTTVGVENYIKTNQLNVIPLTVQEVDGALNVVNPWIMEIPCLPISRTKAESLTNGLRDNEIFFISELGEKQKFYAYIRIPGKEVITLESESKIDLLAYINKNYPSMDIIRDKFDLKSSGKIALLPYIKTFDEACKLINYLDKDADLCFAYRDQDENGIFIFEVSKIPNVIARVENLEQMQEVLFEHEKHFTVFADEIDPSDFVNIGTSDEPVLHTIWTYEAEKIISYFEEYKNPNIIFPFIAKTDFTYYDDGEEVEGIKNNYFCCSWDIAKNKVKIEQFDNANSLGFYLVSHLEKGKNLGMKIGSLLNQLPTLELQPHLANKDFSKLLELIKDDFSGFIYQEEDADSEDYQKFIAYLIETNEFIIRDTLEELHLALIESNVSLNFAPALNFDFDSEYADDKRKAALETLKLSPAATFEDIACARRKLKQIYINMLLKSESAEIKSKCIVKLEKVSEAYKFLMNYVPECQSKIMTMADAGEFTEHLGDDFAGFVFQCNDPDYAFNGKYIAYIIDEGKQIEKDDLESLGQELKNNDKKLNFAPLLNFNLNTKLVVGDDDEAEHFKIHPYFAKQINTHIHQANKHGCANKAFMCTAAQTYRYEELEIQAGSYVCYSYEDGHLKIIVENSIDEFINEITRLREENIDIVTDLSEWKKIV